MAKRQIEEDVAIEESLIPLQKVPNQDIQRNLEVSAILQANKNPIAALQRENKRLKAELQRLKQMQSTTVQSPAPIL